MKKHIDLQQLLQLEDFVGIAEVTGIHIMRFLGAGKKPPYEDITIGKMIEVIQKDYNLTMDEDSERDKWSVVLYKKPIVSPAFNKHCYEDELADALWEAVKYVLETDA